MTKSTRNSMLPSPFGKDPLIKEKTDAKELMMQMVNGKPDSKAITTAFSKLKPRDLAKIANELIQDENYANSLILNILAMKFDKISNFPDQVNQRYGELTPLDITIMMGDEYTPAIRKLVLLGAEVDSNMANAFIPQSVTVQKLIKTKKSNPIDILSSLNIESFSTMKNSPNGRVNQNSPQYTLVLLNRSAVITGIAGLEGLTSFTQIFSSTNPINPGTCDGDMLVALKAQVKIYLTLLRNGNVINQKDNEFGLNRTTALANYFIRNGLTQDFEQLFIDGFAPKGKYLINLMNVAVAKKDIKIIGIILARCNENQGDFSNVYGFEMVESDNADKAKKTRQIFQEIHSGLAIKSSIDIVSNAHDLNLLWKFANACGNKNACEMILARNIELIKEEARNLCVANNILPPPNLDHYVALLAKQTSSVELLNGKNGYLGSISETGLDGVLTSPDLREAAITQLKILLLESLKPGNKKDTNKLGAVAILQSCKADLISRRTDDDIKTAKSLYGTTEEIDGAISTILNPNNTVSLDMMITSSKSDQGGGALKDNQILKSSSRLIKVLKSAFQIKGEVAKENTHEGLDSETNLKLLQINNTHTNLKLKTKEQEPKVAKKASPSSSLLPPVETLPFTTYVQEHNNHEKINPLKGGVQNPAYDPEKKGQSSLPPESANWQQRIIQQSNNNNGSQQTHS